MGRGCGTGDWTTTSAATGSSANDDGDADGVDLRAMADSAIRIGELFGPAVKLSQKRVAWAVLATAVIATPYELVPSLLAFAAAAVLLLGNIEYYWSRTERPPEGLTFGSPLPSDRERADREADSEAESLRQVGVERAGTSAPNDPACQSLSASPAACGVTTHAVVANHSAMAKHSWPNLGVLWWSHSLGAIMTKHTCSLTKHNWPCTHDQALVAMHPGPSIHATLHTCLRKHGRTMTTGRTLPCTHA